MMTENEKSPGQIVYETYCVEYQKRSGDLKVIFGRWAGWWDSYRESWELAANAAREPLLTQVTELKAEVARLTVALETATTQKDQAMHHYVHLLFN